MAPRGTFFFDVGETLGAVIVDAKGRVIRIDAYSYVSEALEGLSKKSLALGLVSSLDGGQALDLDRVLGRELFQYSSPDLLIHASEVDLPKHSVEIFELAVERAKRLRNVDAKDCVYVSENSIGRTLAMLAGMKAAPHPLLAEAVLAGEKPIYVEMVTGAETERAVWGALDKVPVVPLYRTTSDGTMLTIAVTTDGTVPRMQAAGFSVKLLPDEADATHHDLYLLRDMGGLVQNAEFTADLTTKKIIPVMNLSEGLVIALPPQQSIDGFHYGSGHGHNLKLLPDMSLLAQRAVAAPEFLPELSGQEVQTLTSVITEDRMKETLRFVTGTKPRPPVLRRALANDEGATETGSNRHVASPQMRTVTAGLMAAFERIGRGSFKVTGQRFEISGTQVINVRGMPLPEQIELYNVIAELPGESDDLVLVTAHLDSTARNTYGGEYDPKVHNAPGMDDDGSGVAAVLLIAEMMREVFADRRPIRTIRFVLFNAEEQGLIGSGQYARWQADRNAKIVGVFQLDMIGYNNLLPNAFETHAGTSNGEHWPHYHPELEERSLALARLVQQMSELLKTKDLSILTPAQVYQSPDGAAGRSDHASFLLHGYAACATCEDFFPTPGVPPEGNPNYHKVTDQVIDLAFATSIARVVGAAALRVSDPRPTNVAQLLLHYLKLENARHLFGVPGGAIARILQTLQEPEQRHVFDYIVCRHETGAAYMAEGYFRATGNPGVVLVTSGPGATNALTGTMAADTGGSAVITITGEPSEKVLGRGYLQEGVENTLNVPAVYTAATNYSANLTDATSAKILIEQALRDAMSVPRHAVHLSIPDNIASDDLPKESWVADLPRSPERYRASPRGVPHDDDVQWVCDVISAAKRPLIYLGSGCREALRGTNTAAALKALVDGYAMPVMTTMDGKGLFPEGHYPSLGVYGFASCRWPHQWLRPENSEPPCDALLVIGSSLGQLSTNTWHPHLIPRGPFIQIDLDQRVIGRAFDVTRGIVADAGEFIRSLSKDLLSRRPDPKEVATRKQVIERIRGTPKFAQAGDYADPAHWSDYDAQEDNPDGIEPAALIRIVQESLDQDAMIFIDAGNCVGWGAHYFEVNPPTEYHSSLGMGPMGFAVGGVIGAKLGKKHLGEDKICLALVGDAAFLMHGAEVSTARMYNVGAIWIVLTDNDHRMVTQGMRQYTRGGNFEGLYNLGMDFTDFVKFAEGLGADAVLAKDQGELRKAMHNALSGARNNRPQVIIARINPKRVPPYYLPPYRQPTLADYRQERELLAEFWTELKKADLR